jgi:hypothetical protein
MKAPNRHKSWATISSCSTYDFDGYQVVHFTSDRNAFWRFDMDETCVSAVCAYYEGDLRVVEAKDPAIVGTVYKGFWDFTAPDNLHHNILGSWMHCVADTPMSWFCVHSEGTLKRVAFGPPEECPVGDDCFIVRPAIAMYLGK